MIHRGGDTVIQFNEFKGKISHAYFHYGYIDLSLESNRRKFLLSRWARLKYWLVCKYRRLRR